MRLAFHWFYLKSRSLLLVYVGAISDSYTDYFLSRCLSKTTTELAAMCKHKPKNPVFWICGSLRVFAGVLRIFAGCLRGVLVVFFCFLQILCKSALHRKSRRGCGVRPAYPTPMHYSGSLKKSYLHARETGGKYHETFKIIQFPWFLGVSVFDDDSKKKQAISTIIGKQPKGSKYIRRLKIQVYIYVTENTKKHHIIHETLNHP